MEKIATTVLWLQFVTKLSKRPGKLHLWNQKDNGHIASYPRICFALEVRAVRAILETFFIFFSLSEMMLVMPSNEDLMFS
jgi:hypothetical protein